MNYTLETKEEPDQAELEYQKGVVHLCSNNTNITKVPNKYILPLLDRPAGTEPKPNTTNLDHDDDLKLPVIDFAQLLGSERPHVLKLLNEACEKYGFFQVINHGIPHDILCNTIDVSRQFFELPFEKKKKYMSADMREPVRYGTSFNQNKDGVFCWRDFLKLTCNHPLSDVLPLWPSSPPQFRSTMISHSRQTRMLFIKLMEAILESLGLVGNNEEEDDDDDVLKQLEDGSQLMVINCYPKCPEPDLTLGMPPHSDYGFLTLLVQDNAQGLQIQYQGKWVAVKPLHNSIVVNVGDHLEIFSNGRYKSVLHRVVVNSSRTRVSVASLHSMPMENVIQPSPRLIDEENPKRYKDTDFRSFLEYVSSCEPKKQNFLELRKLN